MMTVSLLGIVEPVFADIGAQKGMNGSTLRVMLNEHIQWRLYCPVHNLEKIGHYGSDEQLNIAKIGLRPENCPSARP